MPKTLNAHVTYEDAKRVLSFQKGEEVKALRHHFLTVFSDVLQDDIAPAHVKFQRYDASFKDFVDLPMEEILEENTQVRALIAKQEKQITSAAECEKKHICPHRITWTKLGDSGPVFERYHLIKNNVTYRLWNAVSRQNDSLIQWDPKANKVSCDGSFDMPNQGNYTVLKTLGVGTKGHPYLVCLLFKSNNKDYAMTGNGKGQDITATEITTQPPAPGNKSIFEPFYYWSYTMFRNWYYDTLYLGCDHSGNTTLVVMQDLDYPNPQTLFVANKVILDTASYE